MLHEKINKLIPFISENFITYPLWEEGKYIPFVNFSRRFDKREIESEFFNLIERALKFVGYEIETYNINSTETIFEYRINPEYTSLPNGSFEYINQSWSIEEMIDIISQSLYSNV